MTNTAADGIGEFNPFTAGALVSMTTISNPHFQIKYLFSIPHVLGFISSQQNKNINGKIKLNEYLQECIQIHIVLVGNQNYAMGSKISKQKKIVKYCN